MNEPIDEIFNGTPEAMDEEDIERMSNLNQSVHQIEDPVDTTEQASNESQPQQTASTGAKPTEQKTEEPKKEQTSFQDEGFDAGDAARTVGELGLAIPTGALDFGVDVVNIIPGIDAPKLPKFQLGAAQAFRDIFSIVGPTIGLTVAGQGKLAAANAAGKLGKLRLLSDPLFKKLATMGFGAGVGAGVDAVSEQSEGDNATGILKQSFPAQFGWIPDSVATLDSDSPDIKRQKNVSEGVGIGLLSDSVLGMAKLIRNLSGVKEATRYIPESEKAANWLKKNEPKPAKTGLEEADKSAGSRAKALDDLGLYQTSKMEDPWDEPVLGVHEMFGPEESGIRSVDDMGIVGASVDNARIKGNKGTVHGRLGSVVSDSVLKQMAGEPEAHFKAMKFFRDQLQEGGEVGYRLPNGEILNNKTIQESAEEVAANMGYLTNKELDKVINNFKVGIDADTQLPQLSTVGAVAVRKAMKATMKELGDGVADALVRTSVAGQVSDMAQGARLAEGSAAVPRAIEQMEDRLKLLMVANGEVSKQRGFNLQALRQTFGGKKPLTPQQLRQRGADVIKQLQAEADETIATITEIRKNRPEMFGPLMLAYEATDGNVKTIDALNNYIRNSTGVFSKAFFDGDPEISSLVLRGFWSNVYNNVLSAFATPLRAVASNAAVLIEQGVTPFAGAMIAGDKVGMQRALYTLQGYGDAMSNGRKYFAETMRRSATDPNYAGVAGRESLIQQNEQQMEVLRAFADAAEKEGNLGPSATYAQIEAINDLANHPWLRFGNRSMQAADGFTQAFMGTLDARGKAFDAIQMGRVDADAITEYQQYAYKQLWGKDELGREILTDDALKYAAGEVAMNNDNAANDAISNFLRYVPAAKPFLLFTRTPINMLGFAASHSPFGLFAKEMHTFGRPFKEMTRDGVEAALMSRKIPMDEMAEMNYTRIHQEMLGRKATGTVAVMGAATLFMNSSLTGDGIADRQTQRTRRDADQPKRSFKTPTGHWVSYDGLGAISDWVALTANIMDNFDTLGEANLQKLLTASGFILSASITDKTMLAGIEPIYDIVNGNGAAINRWSSSFLPSAVIPGSSQMAELTRLISPNQRVVEEQFFAMLANRTPAKLGLPEQYDWIDGTIINESNNIISRLWNTYSPMKVSKKISPEKQFLIDVEYDSRPSMSTDGSGTKLTIDEQAQLYRLIGKDGEFKREIQRIMRSTTGKQFRENFKKAQSQATGPLPLKDFDYVHLELDKALNAARAYAVQQINEKNNYALDQRKFDNQKLRQQSLTGFVEETRRMYK